MKNIFTKIALFLLVAVFLGTGCITSASADNACKQIGGTSKEEGTFYVETTERWLFNKDVLKLSQTEGVMNIERVKLTKNVKDTRKMYETYEVKVEKLKNGSVVKVEKYTWTDSSLKIKLDKNSYYRVTVTSLYVKYNGKYPGGSLFNPYETNGLKGLLSMWWAPRGWAKHSTWRVSATKGILGCS